MTDKVLARDNEDFMVTLKRKRSDLQKLVTTTDSLDDMVRLTQKADVLATAIKRAEGGNTFDMLRKYAQSMRAFGSAGEKEGSDLLADAIKWAENAAQ